MSGARRALRAALVAALVMTAGCNVGSFGPRVRDFEPANAGDGVGTHVMLPDRSRIDAELLEVREDGLLLLGAEPTLVFVPWTSVRYATFDRIAAIVSHGRAPTPDQREILRLVSRYPEGLNDARVRELLDAYGLADVRREER